MPDFIGIGSGKCGTTWIYDMIASHPEVHSGHPKEINFFMSNLPYFEKGKEWYESNFVCKVGLKTGEFSVSYLYDRVALERIVGMYPNIKILIAVRDPIGRAESDYLHDQRKGNIPLSLSFSEYIENYYDLKYGQFSIHLDRVFRIFKKEQVLVIPFELIHKEPKLVIKRIYSHIGIDESYIPSSYNQPSNKGFTPKILFLETGMTIFSAWLTKKGFVKFLEILKKTGIHRFIRSFNSGSPKIGTLNSTQVQKMEEHYTSERLIMNDLIEEWSKWKR